MDLVLKRKRIFAQIFVLMLALIFVQILTKTFALIIVRNFSQISEPIFVQPMGLKSGHN